jgi:hypothetical protein
MCGILLISMVNGCFAVTRIKGEQDWNSNNYYKSSEALLCVSNANGAFMQMRYDMLLLKDASNNSQDDITALISSIRETMTYIDEQMTELDKLNISFVLYDKCDTIKESLGTYNSLVNKSLEALDRKDLDAVAKNIESAKTLSSSIKDDFRIVIDDMEENNSMILENSKASEKVQVITTIVTLLVGFLISMGLIVAVGVYIERGNRQDAKYDTSDAITRE